MHANIPSTRRVARISQRDRGGNAPSRLRYKHLAFGVGLALGSLLVCGTATAASGVAATQSPIGGRVVGGAGSIVQRGASTIVNQQSKLLALDWQSFNVGKDASVLFKQPGASAIALNRILDQNPSQIFGKISSNGQIFLINTHGIIFGASAQLNVGGLVASTLDLTPDDFLKKHFDLDAHGGHAGVVNHGTIAAASGGSVSLVGGHVENDGVIVADYGHINLDGADKAVLDFDGNGLINVEITGALKQRLDSDKAAVANKGTLQATSGTVVLQASAAKNLFTNLVNNSGVIKAGGISTAGGVVRLVGTGGNTISSGSIDVSGAHGGSVQVLSDQNVGVTGGGIDASGSTGGGSIRVGGGWQGGEGLTTAQAAYIAPNAVLDVDATRSGNGGSVVVWGDQVNNFYGSISARGGVLGGDGGRIETSSHYGLNAQGKVDASAPFGQAGTWLLDPHDVEITGSAGTLSGTSPDVYYSASADDSKIAASVINSALTGGTNVSIFTGSGGTTQPGDITVSDPITAAGKGSLYLMAAGSILVNSSIKGAGTGNPLNVYLWANYGGAAPGGSTYAYSGNATCTTCKVVIGDSANASIITYGGSVNIRTGDTTHAGGSVSIGSTTAGVTGTIDATDGTNPSGSINVVGTGIAEATGTGNYIHAAAATFDAGAGAIALGDSGNDFTGAVSLNNSGANAVTLDNGSNAVALGSSSVGSGTLTISGVGITQSGAITQAAGAGAATFNAGAGVLTLGDTSNDFTGAVSLNNSGANNVTLDNGGNALTLGAVDVGSGTLDVTDYGTGALTLTGNITTSGGVITFANAVTLDAAAITIDTTGGGATGANVTFDSTIDGATSGSNALTLKAGTAGTVTFTGAVGGGTGGALKSLDVNGNKIMLEGGTVKTTGAQTYNGPVVVMNNDATLATTDSAVSFNDTVDSTGSVAKALTVDSGSGAVTFDGAVGSTSGGVMGALAINGTGTTTFGGTVQSTSVATSSGTTTLGGNVTTSGTQTYNGAVQLDSGITLKTTDNNVTFAGAIDNAVSGTPESLTVAAGTGDVSFGGAVGGGSNGALSALDVSGTGSSTLKGNVTTAGGIVTFGGAVVMAGASVKIDTTGGSAVPAGANVNFDSTVDNASSTTPVALTVDAGTGGAVTFLGAVGGEATSGALKSLDVSGNKIMLEGGTVKTTNAQSYNGAVVVANNDATLNADGVSFNGTVDSTGFAGKSLTVNPGGGAVNFGGAVGSASGGALGALTVNGTGTTTFGGTVQSASLATSSGTTTLGGNVTTSGTQTYNGAVLLNGSGNSVTLTTSGGDVVFIGAVDNKTSGTPEALTVSAGTGDVTFGGAVGGSNGALDALAVSNSGADSFGAVQAASLSTGTGGITLGGNVTTSGAQTYNGAVLLDDSAGDNSLTLTGSAITFSGTLDNAASLGTAQALTVDSGSGQARFNGKVGSINGELGSLNVTGSGQAQFYQSVQAAALAVTGSALLYDNVTTHGTQTYGGPVYLANNIALASNGGDVVFDEKIDDFILSTPEQLQIDAGAGAVKFGGTLGAVEALAKLTVTGQGGITQSSGGINVSGLSSFDAGTGAGNITLNGANGFQGAVDLTGGTTQITNAGALQLGAVNVASLAATAGGAITQTSADNLAVSGTSSFDAGTNAITLANGSNSFGGLIGVTSGGAVEFGGTGTLSIGAVANTDSLTLDNAATLHDDITTTGAQTYNGAVALDGSSNGNKIALTGSAITFSGTLDDATGLGTAQALTVDSGSGQTRFNGKVGSLNQLGALKVTGTGQAQFYQSVQAAALAVTGSALLYDNVTTHGTQTYGGPVYLANNIALASNGGDVVFDEKIDDFILSTPEQLQIDAGAGAVKFGGTLGSAEALAKLTVTGRGGITQSSGGINVSGASSFDAGSAGAITLNGANDFQSTVDLTGATTKISDKNALTLGALATGDLTVTSTGALDLGSGKVTGNLSATSNNGAITQDTTAGKTLTVTGAAGLDAGSGDITLANAGNDFGGAVDLTGGITNISDKSALTLGTLATGNLTASSTGAMNLGSGKVAGNLLVTSNGGAITQDTTAGKALEVTGTTGLDAGAGAITLANTTNSFTGAVTAAGAGVSIATSGDLAIASLNDTTDHDLKLVAGGALTGLTGSIDTGTGDITLAAGGGALSLGSLHGKNLALTGATGITLMGNVKADGTLGLTSTNAPITQSVGTITAKGITTVDAGTGAIALGNANVFDDEVNLTGGTTVLTSSGALKFGTVDVAGLTATAGGDITQDAAKTVQVGGAADFDAGTHAIVLINTSNDFNGLVSATGTGVSISTAHDLQIASLTDHPGGDVSLIAGGGLSGVGAIDAGTGNITLAANGGNLTTSQLTGHDIKLTGKTGIKLADTVKANGGTLTLNSGSTISQNSGAIITADILTGTSTGATTLDEANLIGTLGAFTTNGFSLTNNQALTVANGVAVDGKTGGTALTVNTGDLTVEGTVGNTAGATSLTASNGAIDETTSGIVAATILTGLSSGDTTLTGANQIGTLGNFKADDFTLVNNAALNVTGPLITSGNISLTTTGPGHVLSVGQALTGGMITLASAGDLSVQQGIQASTINLTANGNLAIDALVDSGSGITTLTQNGSGSSITEGSHGAITAGTLTGTAQGGVVLDKANAVTDLGDFTATNGFKLTNGQKLTVAAGHTVDGGASTALQTTGAGSDLQIDGNVKGTTVDLSSSGNVGEGNDGVVTAGVLTGSVAHAANLTGANAIAGLGDFTANGLALNSAGPLTVVAGATADGGASTTLTTTGATGNLVINGTLKGTTTTLNVGGATSEGANGVVSAGTLTGSSAGSTSLTGRNDVANLGDFSANGFALTTDPGLTVVDGATVEGRAGVALTTTGTGNDINIDGTVTGIRVSLTSSGAIAEGANGMVQAGELTGSSAGDTRLTQTEISALDAFDAKNFYLTDAHALSVGGPLTTTGNAGDISLTTTGSGNALTINQAVQGAAIKLTSASDLTIANAVTGTGVTLASNGNLAINAAVSSGTGTTTLAQTGSGAISGGANGAITAGILTGSATGATTLGSDGQFMANHVGVLGGFSSPAGFSLTNDGTLTLASVGGSAYTVDAGKSNLYLEVHDGDLLQNGSNWLYDGSGTWYSTGHIGLANAPIYVTGVDDQNVSFIGRPPAYFYAVDYQGNLLPLTGASSVNVPTSVLSSRSQGINGHTDHYIDISVITANYRGYGVVPPGLLLPPDQWDCAPGQPSPELCPKGN